MPDAHHGGNRYSSIYAGIESNKVEGCGEEGVDLLPDLENYGEFELLCDGLEELIAEPVGPAPLASATRRLQMIVSKKWGRHRFGIEFRRLRSEQTFRVTLWLKVGEESHILLDLRDDQAQHYGTVIFKLPEPAVLRLTGDARAPGYQIRDDGWVRVWVDMTYSGKSGVVYATLLDLADSPEHFGNGEVGFEFGGIEVAEAPAGYGDLLTL